jgi:hypothetical protein
MLKFTVLGLYNKHLFLKEDASIYLCTRYVVDHLPFMEEKYKKLAENFQAKFSYSLISLQESTEDIVQRLVNRFPLISHYLFYHECFGKKIEKIKEKIGEVLKVSFSDL